ncbi:MAG: trypsin-like peptidase domain-containing protein [Planctomycetes bacterium]|nr:trypsin-like peptidase domain-containing protein [Planctomycetota bacterium]
MAKSSEQSMPRIGPVLIFYLALLMVIAAALWRFWPTRPEVGNDPSAKPRPVAPGGPVTTEEKSRIAIYEKAKVSVVNIAAAELRRDLLTMSLQLVPKGSGTGFIWDEKGRVVTNYHVVKGAGRVLVTLDDHTTASVSQIEFDAAHDLAVLWTDIPAAKRKPISIGESSKLQVGQSVLAIGNPFGLDHSLSAGIISSLSRSMKTDDGRIVRGLIQTDAAINPGNSGGPLLDSTGRLIGVNTAIISPSGASAGIGFAIPVDVVNRVIPNLIRGSKAPRPGLGIVEAPDQWSRQRGIPGVLILDVIPGGPADKAGLRPTSRDDDGRILWGDVIVGLDDHKIHSAQELYAVLADHYAIAQEVVVHVIRAGEPVDVRLRLTGDGR